MERLKLEILNERNKIVNVFTDQKTITAKLLELLWSKFISKAKYITRVNYKYNYCDKQTITFYTDNKYKFVFKGIPTSWGSIQDFKIVELLKEE